TALPALPKKVSGKLDSSWHFIVVTVFLEHYELNNVLRMNGINGFLNQPFVLCPNLSLFGLIYKRMLFDSNKHYSSPRCNGRNNFMTSHSNCWYIRFNGKQRSEQNCSTV